MLVVLGVLAALLLPAAVPALAEAPRRLDDQVTDSVGALSGSEGGVRKELDDLRVSDGTQLWVVFVSSFDGVDGTTWAERTARESQLGGNDVLFAVAVDDRAYGYWFAPSSKRSADHVDALIADDVEPKLADRDWSGAVVAFAEGLEPPSVWPVAVGIAVVLLLGVGLLTVNGRRKRRRAEEEHRRREDPFPGEPTGSVQGRAAEALLEVDEALRASRVDLDFGKQQYGEAAVAAAAAAFAQARGELEQAFAIRQRLDDEQPEDDETTRKMLAEILRLAGSADARLDTQAAAFARLRDLEKNAPRLLDGLAARLSALATRLRQEEAALARLRARWARTALAPEDDNDEEARARLAAAQEAVASGREELAAGRPGTAAPAVRAAEAALTAATTLLDAVGRRAQELEDAAARLPAARAEAERDLGEARALAASGTERTGLAEQVARAEQALAAADALANATPPDPLHALEQLQAADRALDAALDRAKDAQARQQAAQARLDRVLAGARSRVAGATDLVTTRGSRIGSVARTSLASAQRALADAEAAALTDAVVAVAAAERAAALAQAAQQQAEGDLARAQPGWTWSSGGYRGGFGGSRGGYRSSHRSTRGRSSSSGGGRRHGGGGRF